MARKKAKKKAKKRKASRPRSSDQTKEQICVRMSKELFDLVVRDARAGERKNPAQVRMILRKHYAKELGKKRRR